MGQGELDSLKIRVSKVNLGPQTGQSRNHSNQMIPMLPLCMLTRDFGVTFPITTAKIVSEEKDSDRLKATER